MTASTNPTDDIIELTEIVEEGIPLDKTFEDFAMDKAVDSKSLDQELDDLLNDAASRPKAASMATDELDLDILVDEPAPAAPQPEPSPVKTQAQAPGMDMADLDDLFDSLGLGEKDDGDTALDISLDGDIPQADKPEMKTFYPSDSINLELELPGLENGDKDGNVHDLTDELLADIPETTLLHAPEEPMRAPLAQDLSVTPFAQDDLEDASDILELTEEHVDQGDSLAEEESTVATVQEKPAADLIDGLAQQPAAPPLDAPDSPEPVQTEAQTAPPAEPSPTISHAELEIISSRLDALESRPQAAPMLKTEDILALMPFSPQELPVTQNLRREILEHVEARLAELAASASVDGLQESVNALQSQVESIPDIRAELAKIPPLSAMQKLETDLDELRALVRDQADAMTALRQSLTEKDTALAELKAEESRLREELARVAARADSAPPMDAVKNELQEYIRQQVPLAAAKVIREEIQSLLKELGS